jgi:hypothetical protein
MIVNVSSSIGNHGSYFSSSSDFNKSSEGNVLAYRRNGFSSAEDKLGFPSMIYTTFPHSAPGAVTLTQSFDNRLPTTTSPKTTLITPINGEMSPTDETFDHQAKSDNQPHAIDSTMMEAASLNDQPSSDDPLENGSSHQGSVPTTPNSTSSVTLTGSSFIYLLLDDSIEYDTLLFVVVENLHKKLEVKTIRNFMPILYIYKSGKIMTFRIWNFETSKNLFL